MFYPSYATRGQIPSDASTYPQHTGVLPLYSVDSVVDTNTSSVFPLVPTLFSDIINITQLHTFFRHMMGYSSDFS